jgi:hypothetical protein
MRSCALCHQGTLKKVLELTWIKYCSVFNTNNVFRYIYRNFLNLRGAYWNLEFAKGRHCFPYIFVTAATEGSRRLRITAAHLLWHGIYISSCLGLLTGRITWAGLLLPWRRELSRVPEGEMARETEGTSELQVRRATEVRESDESWQ